VFDRSRAPGPAPEGQPARCAASPVAGPVTLPPLGTKTILLPRDTSNVASCAYIGSVTVHGQGGQVAVLANQVSPAGAGTLATYTGMPG
jgi:hypothetical protein